MALVLGGSGEGQVAERLHDARRFWQETPGFDSLGSISQFMGRTPGQSCPNEGNPGYSEAALARNVDWNWVDADPPYRQGRGQPGLRSTNGWV